MPDAIELNGVQLPTAFMTERLATLFHDVWHKLPEIDRKRMIEYWNGREQQGILADPVVAVTNKMVDNKALGATNMFGFMLRFWKTFVDKGFEAKVQDVIAHELAHVFDYATNGKDSDASEEFADDTMRRWGFNPDSVKDA